MGKNAQSGGKVKMIKPRTRAGKRALEFRGPKLVENVKTILLLKGNKTSQIVKDFMIDMRKLKMTESVQYTKKNPDVRPFDAGGDVELTRYARKSDCPIFGLASHQKKRPDNFVFGRFFDWQLMDMVEFGINRETFKSMKHFPAASKAQAGNKPCMVFIGELFSTEPDFSLAREILLDTFRGEEVKTINLVGIDRVIVATATENRQILFRQYSIGLKKSGTRIPRAQLSEIGPRADFTIRRVQHAAYDLRQQAMKHPKLQKKKEKNVTTNLLDGTVGRLYVPQQNLQNVVMKKSKGTKRERRENAAQQKQQKRQKQDATETES
eukprot:TRINITY_DN3384_c0_g1_i4.p1 TRINITY_DN3384_c0_g1~~TRINITY_DN3384_c0_g1_i4.p1  ORF type:complete len:323 (+),score=51.04 TRINITY_DN3384_c0_g1_i4:68-1036(+)